MSPRVHIKIHTHHTVLTLFLYKKSQPCLLVIEIPDNATGMVPGIDILQSWLNRPMVQWIRNGGDPESKEREEGSFHSVKPFILLKTLISIANTYNLYAKRVCSKCLVGLERCWVVGVHSTETRSDTPRVPLNALCVLR